MTTPAGSLRYRAAEWWIAVLMTVAAAALLAVGTLAGMNVDDDELGTAALTTMVQAQAVRHGDLPFWSSRLAFGLPQPGAQSLFVHPLMPLFAWWDPSAAVTAVYAAHIIIGAVAFWWLCSVLMLSPLTSGLCTATFLLSSPSLQYTLNDGLPTYFVAWTLAPVALALMIRLLDDPPPHTRVAVGLGLVAGLMLVDGHLGHAPFLLGTLALGCLPYAGRMRSRRTWFFLAAGLALAIASHRIGITIDEYRRFPGTIPRTIPPSPAETLGLRALWDVFLRPLAPGRLEQMAQLTMWRGNYRIFFGGPFALLALAGLLRPAWTHRWRPLLAAIIGASLALMAISTRWPLFALSGTYLLRDAIVIAGIALAGLTLDRLIANSGWRRTRGVLVTLQLLAIGGGTWPFVAQSLAAARAFEDGGRDASVRPLADRLVALSRSDPGRIYFTPGAEQFLWNDPGIDRPTRWNTSLTYAGVRRINGLFKGISTEPLAPAFLLPYGTVEGSAALSMSTAALTALGVRHVVAFGAEPISADLVLLAAWPTPGGPLHLLDNFRAWPGAHFVRSSALAGDLPLLPGCPHTRLLCRDFTPVIAAAEEPVDAIRYGEGAMTIRFAPAARDRTLLVTEMIRDGWYALVDGRRGAVTPVFGALMRVDVPAGASSVELRYRPAGRVALAAFSWGTVLVAAFLSLSPWPLEKKGPVARASLVHAPIDS